MPARHDPSPSKALFSLDPNTWRVLKARLKLSLRQEEIVGLILRGCSDKQIAAQLDLRVPTVRTHLSRLFLRLGVRDRVELILRVFAEVQSIWRVGERNH